MFQSDRFIDYWLPIDRLIVRSLPLATITSGYNNTIDVPALFRRILFPELLRLQGAQGAKSVIERYPAQIVPIEFPQEAIDLDSPEDYRKYEHLTPKI